VSPRRRSVRIAGHATSVSLEDAFWEELGRAARAEGKSVAALIAEIDAGRATGRAVGETAPGLSGALRLYVLERLRREAGRGRGRPTAGFI